MKFIHAADIHLDSPLVGLQFCEGAPVQTRPTFFYARTDKTEQTEQTNKSLTFPCVSHIWERRRGSGVVLGVITETLCFPEGTLRIIEGPESPI